ncbi:restriction endonuclease S subunit [Rhizobium leguminosarum bv. trifolii WSM2297]|uniref:Restriction endonuclease S subunit n=1 Tax=Rhizobium leguminosarum bv. trifolii WSM2297 TaxID=754762 RepID=J0D0I0_RHILT|nr:restriction endonuclease subunit S [Rhizobium leguminosarum]EJC85311.1 restriction endonuclease S subunit [Rhizobium leguminosarum bv. trifolii WSM2297]EJC85805.1 restriction endonuclease S subunit [Rhizobium leguminosarum bv. trifolii WSM2297]
MMAQNQFPRHRLKFAATINDETLTEDVDPDFEIQYIDIGNVNSSGTVDQVASYRFEAAPSRARRIVRDGDVIISTVRTYLQAIAPITAPPENLIVSTGFAVIRPRPDMMDPKFCRYVLREPTFLAEVEMRSTGISYPAINASEIGDIAIPLPPISAQKMIADYVETETAEIDTLIGAKQRLLELMAEKRRAIVAEAVMRGLEPSAPLRPSGIDWLGDIPAHWKVRRVATMFSQRDERNEPDLPLLEVSINSGVAVREFSSDKIEGTAADFNTYKIACRGDIAFNKMRMWQGAVGVAPVDGLVSPDYTVATAKAELLPEYAGQLFRTASFSAECGRNSQGITWDRLRLYWDGFRDIFMPVPPLHEQQQLVDHITAETAKIDRLRASTENSIALLRERRAALIAAAVTGQIEIPEAA